MIIKFTYKKRSGGKIECSGWGFMDSLYTGKHDYHQPRNVFESLETEEYILRVNN
jgi:hypothetical protein